MKKLLSLIRKRIFIVTLLAGYFAYFVLTMAIFDISRPGFGVGTVHYGYPFTYFTSHCFGGNYDIGGLMLNILFALFVSAVISLFVSFTWLVTLKPKLEGFDIDAFRRKWHL